MVQYRRCVFVPLISLLFLVYVFLRLRAQRFDSICTEKHGRKPVRAGVEERTSLVRGGCRTGKYNIAPQRVT